MYAWYGWTLTTICSAALLVLTIDIWRSSQWFFRLGTFTTINILLLGPLWVMAIFEREPTREYPGSYDMLLFRRPTGPLPVGIATSPRRWAKVVCIALALLAVNFSGAGLVLGGIQPCSWPDVLFRQSGCRGTLAIDGGLRSGVRSFVYTPDGALLATATDVNTVEIRRRDRSVVYTFPHLGIVDDVAVSPDGRLVATAGRNDGVQLWDLRTGTHVRTMIPANRNMSVVFTPDGTTVLSGTGVGEVYQWQVDNGRVVHVYGPAVAGYGVGDIALSSDGTQLAAGIATNPGGIIRVWRMHDQSLVHTLQSGNVYDVVFAPKAPILAAAGYGPHVQIWNVDTGRRETSLAWTAEEDERFVSVVLFSRDGDVVVAGADDGSIHFWSVPGYRLIQMYHYSDGIRSLAFDPVDPSMIAGSWDGSIRRWPIPDPLGIR